MLKADDLLPPTIEEEAAEEKINRNTGRAVPMDIDVDDDVGQVVDMSNVRVDDEQVWWTLIFLFLETFSWQKINFVLLYSCFVRSINEHHLAWFTRGFPYCQSDILLSQILYTFPRRLWRHWWPIFFQDDIGLQRALARARLLKLRARHGEDAGAKIIENLAASVQTEQDIENGTTGAGNWLHCTQPDPYYKLPSLCMTKSIATVNYPALNHSWYACFQVQ